MNEQEAARKLDFHQEIHYDWDVIDIYFDVHWDGEYSHASETSQAFYKGANITGMVNWEKINKEINWKRVKEEAQDNEY